jgi:hypothetical protein
MPRSSTKSRAPDDTRQTALRMRESDHAWLVQEAKKHRTTLNSEILWRLLNSRNNHLGVELQVIVETVIPRLEPYLISANERDWYNDGFLAARQLADICAAQLAAGKLEGLAAKRAAAAINSIHLARHNLELASGENKPLVQGHASFRAAAEARFEAEVRIKEAVVEEHGVKEPEAKEPSDKESLR